MIVLFKFVHCRNCCCSGEWCGPCASHFLFFSGERGGVLSMDFMSSCPSWIIIAVSIKVSIKFIKLIWQLTVLCMGVSACIHSNLSEETNLHFILMEHSHSFSWCVYLQSCMTHWLCKVSQSGINHLLFQDVILPHCSLRFI